MLTAVALLACGCGGSNGGGVDTGDPQLDALISAAQADIDAYEAIFDSEGYTPFSEVGNQSGSVSYDGIAVVLEGQVTGGNNPTEVTEYAAIGSFDVTVDFGMAQSATGRAFDFFELTNPELLDNVDADIEDTRTSGPVAGEFNFVWDIEEDSFNEAVLAGTVTGSLTKQAGGQVGLTGTPADGFFVGNDFDAIEVSASDFQDPEFTDIVAFGFRE